MRMIASVSIVMMSLALGCAQGKEKKEGDTKEADGEGEKSAEGSGEGQQGEPDEVDNGLYTGVAAGKDFSIILPGFRGYTSADESIAKVEKVEVTLSEATVKTLIDDMKKKNPDADTECITKMFSKPRPSYKVTPLKAGKVELKSARPKGRKSGGFKGNNEKLQLVVTAYTEEQLAAGEKRYSTDGGGGNLIDCKSCHASGKEGAPPHEMGRIMEISDKEALQWVKTGEVGDRKAKITHTWEFSSEEDEKGIVAYLRSLQTKDIETLTKLYFEEAKANGFDGGGFGLQGPGGPGGPGGKGCFGGKKSGGGEGSTNNSTGSSTSTGTGN